MLEKTVHISSVRDDFRRIAPLMRIVNACSGARVYAQLLTESFGLLGDRVGRLLVTELHDFGLC